MIKEFDKVRLVTGEVAHIVEVSKQGVAYVAEVMRKNGEFSVSVEPLAHSDIASIFVEMETPIVQAS